MSCTYACYDCTHACYELYFGTFGGPTSVCSTSALNDLYHSTLALSEFSQLLSVDSPKDKNCKLMD